MASVRPIRATASTMAAAKGARRHVALADGARRSMRVIKRRVEEIRPIIAGAMPEGARFAARSMIVEAYADRSVSPRAASASSSHAASRSACICRIVHQAAGLNQWSVRAKRSSQFAHKSPRTRCASSCASTCRSLWLDGFRDDRFRDDDPGLQGSRNAGADRFRRHEQVGTCSSIRLAGRHVSSSESTAASVTGRQTESRRRRMNIAPRS